MAVLSTGALYCSALFVLCCTSAALDHALSLHYVRLLDVFPTPDPKPAVRDWGLVQGDEEDLAMWKRENTK